MTTIGWAALGALGTKVTAQSSTLLEMLAYSTAMIAVCAAVAGFVSLAVGDRAQRERPSDDETLYSEPAMLTMLAGRTRFAESRARLLCAAERFGSRKRTAAPLNSAHDYTKF